MSLEEVTYMNYYEYNDYLAHYGVKGQKWGVRRYQNADGTLTRAGRKRLYKDVKKASTSDNKYAWQDKYANQLRKGANDAKNEFEFASTHNLTARERIDNLNKSSQKAAQELLKEYSDKSIESLSVKNRRTAESFVANAIVSLGCDEFHRERPPKDLHKEYDKFDDNDKTLVNTLSKNFSTNRHGSYEQWFKDTVANVKDVEINVTSTHGHEKVDSISAVSFIRKYNNSDNVKKDAVKQFYDHTGTKLDEKTIKLKAIEIDSSYRTYRAYYDAGDVTTVVEVGDLDTRKRNGTRLGFDDEP
jgi:hypothetical protein